MKTGIEALSDICYKLLMMSIPIDGATHIYEDSMYVINNTSKPESVLKKKNNTVCHHSRHKSEAMGESLTTHIDGVENPAELFTKVICGGKRRCIVKTFFMTCMMVSLNHAQQLSKQVCPNPVLSKILEGTR